ncbi:MAG: fumarylacetoacetate hydrolase family protein, partial [Hydrogenophaga sp.]|nr:fumarylacetoacetate hydrolase family protein [Hydrogenophaga sp.]
MKHLNETHDQALRSWVSSANVPGNDFPIQNLPFASFKRRGIQESYRVGVAIGDMVLDMAAVDTSSVLSGEVSKAVQACAEDKLNALMSLGPDTWSVLRLALSRSLREGAPECSSLQACLVPQAEVEYDLPARIGDYTDFYTSIHHATNVGRQFRADNPLLPNYKWIPIGYHGRASSIGVSRHGIRRPSGQTMAPGAEKPDFGPSKRLDFELELGAFIGHGNRQGEPVRIDEADRHLFGVCLLNDWSARDIQSWEYQPLGPFLSKNFATSISPWVVTLEALAPYRCALVRP